MHGLTDYPQAIWDLATGKTREELEALRKELSVQKKQIEGMTAAVASMPDGPQKSEAWALRVKAQQAWMPVVREFNDAALKHNEASVKLKEASFGAYDAGRVSTSLSGLGVAPIIIGAAATVAIVSILLSLSTLIDSIKSRSTEVKGYMSQFADVVNAGGGVLEQTSGLFKTVTNTALVIAGLAGVYYAVKWYRGAKSAVSGVS